MVEIKAKKPVKDRYGGIEIKDISILPDTEAEFELLLADWIKEWKTDGVRSV